MNNEEKCCDSLLNITSSKRDELLTSLPSSDDLNNLSMFFKLFGDPTRIKLLSILSKGELCVCDMASILSMSQSSVSHQLKTLKANRLIKFRREGKSLIYSLDDEHINDILSMGLEHVLE